MNQQLADTLNYYFDLYNRIDFIELDPIYVPHQFTNKEDIEISGLLIATIAWGQRTTIIKKGLKLMQLMDKAPHDFILHATKKELQTLNQFVHRTFNGNDCIAFAAGLRKIYKNFKGLSFLFENYLNEHPDDFAGAIHHFRKTFLEGNDSTRIKKHIADPLANSSAKRICMYLRWMVRKEKRGVDFGLWNISPSVLYCPLDVHSGRIARELGLLNRKQNDWKAVEELTAALRTFDKNDPVKYDFALFGLGVMPPNPQRGNNTNSVDGLYSPFGG